MNCLALICVAKLRRGEEIIGRTPFSLPFPLGRGEIERGDGKYNYLSPYI